MGALDPARRGIPMDNETKIWLTFWAFALVVVLAILGLFYWVQVIVPQRMAAQGYCWQSVTVPATVGASAQVYASYLPCPPKPEEAK